MARQVVDFEAVREPVGARCFITDECLALTEHEADELAARLRETLQDGRRG